MLRQYVALNGSTAKRQFLKANPEVLTPAAEEQLSAVASAQRTEDARAALERIRSELRACREQGIDQALPEEPPAERERGALLNALTALMSAPSLEAMKMVIRDNPKLLTPDAEVLLSQPGDERTAPHLARYRQLLVRCRHVGVDAAFAEVERPARDQALPREVAEAFFNILTARSLGEIEQTLRREPRVVQARFRNLLGGFLAQNNHFGIPAPLLQQRFDLLDECDRHGIDVTLARLAPRPPTNADATQAFNAAIRQFNDGVNPAEIYREATVLLSQLQDLPRRSCMLLALVAAQRAGQHAPARALAVQLNREVSGWDLPGIPQEAMGPAVTEMRDVTPVLTALDLLLQAPGIPRDEMEAVQSLRRQYAQRQPGAAP